MKQPVLFISTMGGSPWGGSEELWSQAAGVLVRKNVPTAASVQGWPELHHRIHELMRLGIDIRPRTYAPTFFDQARRYLSKKPKLVWDVEQSFGKAHPRLVVMSSGSVLPPVELLEMCIEKNWPFVTVAHSNRTDWWPSDELARAYREVLPLARRCFFVSKSSWELAEYQLGHVFKNAEIFQNPVLVKSKEPLPWPSGSNGKLRMAAVGNLFPTEKGQDILLEVLARPGWRERGWELSIYGKGPNREILERLSGRLGLSGKVFFRGYESIERIWQDHHVLTMPSRFEGMPLTIVEAMFYGRPVVATKVGGIAELVDDGQTGYLAEAPVPDCFERALERMWQQRDELREMGERAATRIKARFPENPVERFVARLQDFSRLKV